MGNVGNSAWQVLGLCLWVVITTALMQIEASAIFREAGEDAGRLQRKPLTEDDRQTILNASNSKESDGTGSGPWPVLVGLLLSALSVAFVMLLVVKFRIVQRVCGGYTEALLPEGDAVSQFSQAESLPAHFPGHDMRERDACADSHDDDDGFIEDNYITASDRERVAREEADEESDDELDIHFSIE